MAVDPDRNDAKDTTGKLGADEAMIVKVCSDIYNLLMRTKYKSLLDLSTIWIIVAQRQVSQVRCLSKQALSLAERNFKSGGW